MCPDALPGSRHFGGNRNFKSNKQEKNLKVAPSLTLLFVCCGASVPRYDSAFHLAMSEVRAKHFRQDTANSKNLTLCNQKHRLFLYLLGKCFAPTNPAESLGNRTPYQFLVPSSQLIDATNLIIRGASRGSQPCDDIGKIA